MAVPSSATQADREVLAGIVERVTFHSVETGSCVLHVVARGHRDFATIVGRAATIAAGESIAASGDWLNDCHPGSGRQVSCLLAAQRPVECSGRGCIQSTAEQSVLYLIYFSEATEPRHPGRDLRG